MNVRQKVSDLKRHPCRADAVSRSPISKLLMAAEEGPSKRCKALVNLLRTVEGLLTDFSSDINQVLAPIVEHALQESEGDVALPAVLHSFGWENGRFTQPVDIRALSSRLKALMFHGLQEKGKGSYAVVYKVGLAASRSPKVMRCACCLVD